MKRARTAGFLILIISSAAAAQGFGSNPKAAGKNRQEKAPAAAAITPGSIDFGDQVTKTASKPQTITVTNTGEKELYINSVVLGGDNKEDFGIVTDRCTGVSVASKKSCVIDIRFTPTVTEARKAELVFTDNAIDSPQRVPLTGNGINSVRVPPSR